MEKKSKEEKIKAEREKDNLVRKDIDAQMEIFEKNKQAMKLPVFTSILENILKAWNHKTKDKEFNEHIGLSSAKVLDLGFREKELSTFYEGLSLENKTLLIKVFFAMYERIGNKSNVFQIKASKLLSVQNKLVGATGIGGVARAMFSIQK